MPDTSSGKGGKEADYDPNKSSLQETRLSRCINYFPTTTIVLIFVHLDCDGFLLTGLLIGIKSLDL
jgi:hypothetical protein